VRAREWSAKIRSNPCGHAASFCRFILPLRIFYGFHTRNFGTRNQLGFWTPKTLTILSYKYTRVLKKYNREDAHHASICLLRRRVRFFIPFVGVHRRSGEQVSGTSSSVILHRERAIRILGSALRDCSNASTSPSSTSSSPRLVFLVVSGARLGVVKRGGADRRRHLLYPVIPIRQDTYGFLSLTISFIPSMI
jgi:hypothetical protein